MAQNFHVTPVTANKPRESSSPSTILQLANGLIKAIAVPANVVPKKELEGGRNPKVVVGPDNTTTTPGKRVDGAFANAPAKPQAPTPTPQPHKVIVVGAGISGLRAASILRSHNVDVVVLEGRQRIGGRIYTSREKTGAPRDIGAAWMHETSQNKLVGLIRQLNVEYYYDDGTPLYYTRDGRAGSQFKAKKVADEFADYCEWYYDENPEAADKSVYDFIREYVSTHPLATADEIRWAPQAAREVEAWIGTSLEAASSKHLNYFATERNLYMKGGYDSVVNWTAASILDAIQLGQTVKKIDWNEDTGPVAVHTTTEDGKAHVFKADAVICTVPLGVLRHGLIDFNPALPQELALGLSKLSYGALGKIFFEFDTVFWSKDNDQFIYYPTPTDGPIDETSIFSYMTVTSNNWIMSGTKELSVQIVEPLTQRIESMNSQEVYAFFEPLFRLFRTEPHKELPPLISLETTHWTQDPFAGFGTYTADKTGDEPEIWMEGLANTTGSRLQFAGEHCTPIGSGCVHGAFATGETAAVNLLGALDVPHNGGDAYSVHTRKRSPRRRSS